MNDFFCVAIFLTTNIIGLTTRIAHALKQITIQNK